MHKNQLWLQVTRFLKDRFNLESDKANDDETIQYIERNVDFKGANLWILIFAIFIASIGLNVNSPAVIIGAMLISPLMGPILGIGLGVAIFDIDLLRRSVNSLTVAVVISILTSALYFSISPLSDAQSELLARTTPTIWDVLIALFGGLAGIVAGTRKEKGNAIPGVAIATALMPPLCTVGYGLAIGNWYYFFGAFYLFFINSVFISLSTFLVVRYLKFPRKEFVDRARERRVKTIITIFTIITILPSIYLGYVVVKRSIFERNASLFVNQELAFPNSKVINRNFHYDEESPKIEVTLFGEPVEQELLELSREKLRNYGLEDAELVVFQGYKDNIDPTSIESAIRRGIIEELYAKNEQLLASKEERIRFLENELIRARQVSRLAQEVAPELKVLNREIREFSLDRTLLTSMDSLRQDTVYLAYLRFDKKPYAAELKKLEEWLRARLKSSDVKLIVQ